MGRKGAAKGQEGEGGRLRGMAEGRGSRRELYVSSHGLEVPDVLKVNGFARTEFCLI